MASNAAKGSSIRRTLGRNARARAYGHALFHSSGEFMDTSMRKVVQAYRFQVFQSYLEAFCARIR